MQDKGCGIQDTGCVDCEYLLHCCPVNLLPCYPVTPLPCHLRRLPERQWYFLDFTCDVNRDFADIILNGFRDQHCTLCEHIHLAAVANTERAAAIDIVMLSCFRIERVKAGFTLVLMIAGITHVNTGKCCEEKYIQRKYDPQDLHSG